MISPIVFTYTLLARNTAEHTHHSPTNSRMSTQSVNSVLLATGARLLGHYMKYIVRYR